MTRVAATAADSAVPIVKPPRNVRHHRYNVPSLAAAGADAGAGAGNIASMRLRRCAGVVSFRLAAAMASRLAGLDFSLLAQPEHPATGASTSRAWQASSSPSASA